MALKKRKKGRSISVDMEGVTSGGFSVPDADYKVKVVEVTEEEGNESGEPYLSWELEIIEGKHKGTKLYHITSLQKQALFNLRRTLEACGMEIPDSAMDLDLDELTDLTLGVTTEQEEYKGKKKSRVIDTFNPDAPDEEEEAEETEEEEEEEAPKKKKKKPVVEEDEEEEEEPAPKKKKKPVEEDDDEEEEAPKKKKKAPVEDEEDDEEEEAPKKKKKPVDEDEEEEEPAPKKKSKKAEPEFEEGQRVSFDDEDGNTLKGKIESLDEDSGTAKVNVKGEVWEVELSDLSVV